MKELGVYSLNKTEAGSKMFINIGQTRQVDLVPAQAPNLG